MIKIGDGTVTSLTSCFTGMTYPHIKRVIWAKIMRISPSEPLLAF